MTAPLNTHIQTNLIEMVKDKLLLERITLNGVNVNIKDTEGRNPLYWAIKRRSTHNANLLVSFGSSLMVSQYTHAIFHAIECGHHEMLVLLIKKGLDVNIVDNNGKTALMYAIESEAFETVKFLVRNGADLYLLDDTLNMAEDYAKKCDSKIIKEYLQHIVYTDMAITPCLTSTCKCDTKAKL